MWMWRVWIQMRSVNEIMRYATEVPGKEPVPVSAREFRMLVAWFRVSARFPASVPKVVRTMSLCGKPVEVVR